MNIRLKPEQEQLIQEQIESGRYATVDEAISKLHFVNAQAFQLLEEDTRHYQLWVKETRKKVEVGLAQLKRGEKEDGEVVIARLREKFRKSRESQA